MRTRSALTWVATSALTLVASAGVVALVSHPSANRTPTTTTQGPARVATTVTAPPRPPTVQYGGDGAEGAGSYAPGPSYSSDN